VMFNNIYSSLILVNRSKANFSKKVIFFHFFFALPAASSGAIFILW